jgi:hypothetical protein
MLNYFIIILIHLFITDIYSLLYRNLNSITDGNIISAFNFVLDDHMRAISPSRLKWCYQVKWLDWDKTSLLMTLTSHSSHIEVGCRFRTVHPAEADQKLGISIMMNNSTLFASCATWHEECVIHRQRRELQFLIAEVNVREARPQASATHDVKCITETQSLLLHCGTLPQKLTIHKIKLLH